MNVVIAVGGTSQKIINSLKTSADNVNFYTYNSIGSMIKESNLRKLTFDRIIMSKAIINSSNPEKDFESLNSYIKNFSSFSEIVFIVDSNSMDLQEKFTRVFNSPMYLCAMMSKASVSAMLDIVKKPMESLHEVYCGNSKEADKILVAGTQQQQKEEQKPKSEKQDKKGFFGGLGFGRKKVKEENIEPQVVNPKTEVGEFASDENPDLASKNTVKESTSTPSSSSDDNLESNNVSNSFFSDEEVRSPFGDGDFSSPEISYDDLAVGDFGRNHSDTGYLNEEDEEELKRFADLKDTEIKPEESENSFIVKDFEDVPDEVFIEENTVIKESSVEEIAHKASLEVLDGVSLFISSNGCYTHALNCALAGVESERRVLLVDMYGGFSSSITLDKYYRDVVGCNNIYRFNGVSVVSLGIGVSTKLSSVTPHIEGWLREYDSVLIDCPIGSLDCSLPYGNVYIVCDGSKYDMLNISLGLTNRSVVPLRVERDVIENCKVIGDLDSSIVNEVKDVCMFANGCWL